MGQAVHIDKHRRVVEAKRGLLLDTGVLAHFLDMNKIAEFQRKDYMSRHFRQDARFDRVAGLFPNAKANTTLANVIEVINWIRPTRQAAANVREHIFSELNVIEASNELARQALARYEENLERFPDNEAKLRGAGDVYTASAAIERHLIVVTFDFVDFDRIEGVDYLVGW